jgi:hypothetical protein
MIAAFQVIAAFDMICAGTLRTGPVGLALPEEAGQPFSITYRIDVDGGRWCADACTEAETLASVTEGVLVLRERYDADGSSVIMLNPRTGRFSDTFIEGSVAVLRSGTCAPAPFTGFPSESA